MIKGKVVGRLWATKRVQSLPQGGLLEVELESGARLIAFDPLGCAEGEEVLLQIIDQQDLDDGLAHHARSNARNSATIDDSGTIFASGTSRSAAAGIVGASAVAGS